MRNNNFNREQISAFNGVTILFNDPSSADTVFAESTKGVLDQVDAVAQACTEMLIPHRSVAIRTIKDLPALLADDNASVIINLVEDLPDDGANYIPALCAAYDKKCTGNGSTTLTLSFDKQITKTILTSNTIPTPDSIVVFPGIAHQNLFTKGTFIVKPIKADASEGIFADSVISGEGDDLAEKISALVNRSQCPMLVEHYIEGREVNVSIIEINGIPTVLPIAEILFVDFPAEKPRIVDYTAKWILDSFESKNTVRSVPALFDKQTTAAINEYALQSWHALGCKGYARIDMRIADDGAVYVIEANPNPDISPDAGFIAAAKAAGMSYADVVHHIISSAVTEGRIPSEERSQQPDGAYINREKMISPDISIARSLLHERADIIAIATATGFFVEDEIDIVKELFDDAVRHGATGHYQAYTACIGNEVVGWLCFGHVPGTTSTYDIYWIIVKPSCQGKKIGSALLSFAEKTIADLGGTIAVLETSNNAQYKPTRIFYERRGYRVHACLKDFYFPGSDKIIYLKNVVIASIKH